MRRAAELLAEFGFATADLPGGLLLASASMGRRGYAVAVAVVGEREVPDWDRLTATRRGSGARYLAVFGDHRDLHRLEGAARRAGASLWSWAGLERARDLARFVWLGPAELEARFAGDGLHGAGLEDLEREVADNLARRGLLSQVLLKLAAQEAPAAFRLEDLLDLDAAGPAEPHAYKEVLERLSQPPFELVMTGAHGEWVLRRSVASCLDDLARYALSLREELALAEGEGARGPAGPAPRREAPGRRR